jgi:5-(carboxyamino)imidazole ribonucleotide synthase
LTLFKNKISISKPVRLGIVGGGQLGKMMAFEAKRMFMKVIILDPSKDCPASSLADKLIIGDFSDAQKIYDLSSEVDIITFEIELANATALNNLEESGFLVHPSPKTLSIIQNKYRQKKFLRENLITVPDFELVSSEEQLMYYCSNSGFPVLLKACEDSYDGRGNYLIRSENEISKALIYFSGRQCMVEKFVNFKKEISIMVARNLSGNISYFPIAENIHENHILKTSIIPARISKETEGKAIDLAIMTMKSLKGSGIFGIEMFVDEEDNVLINEIAPRPHNSGHYSIEACSISQFEQHIRAILDYTLLQPILLSDAVMINILGPDNYTGPYEIAGIDKLFAIPGAKIHIYGKLETKPNRKLGHVTIVSNNLDPLLTKRNVEDLLKVREPSS